MTAKRITSFLIALILTLSLAACGAKGDTYRDDVSVGTLSDAIEAKIPVTGGYIFSEADFLTYYFNGNTAIDAFAIASSAESSDVNEYGILHVNDPAQVQEVAEMAEVYLSNQRDFLSTFVNTYNAAEMAKLEAMRVEVYGNYVIFTILSEADTATVFAAAEDMLKQ